MPMANVPHQEWLADLRDHWRTQSMGDFRGWIHPDLDKFVTTDERREKVLSLFREITSQSGLPRETQQTAKLLESLLRGQITTDASSPLDYMVSGNQPYKWSENHSKPKE